MRLGSPTRRIWRRYSSKWRVGRRVWPIRMRVTLLIGLCALLSSEMRHWAVADHGLKDRCCISLMAALVASKVSETRDNKQTQLVMSSCSYSLRNLDAQILEPVKESSRNTFSKFLSALAARDSFNEAGCSLILWRIGRGFGLRL